MGQHLGVEEGEGGGVSLIWGRRARAAIAGGVGKRGVEKRPRGEEVWSGMQTDPPPTLSASAHVNVEEDIK